MLLIDLTNKFISGIAKKKNIDKYGLIRASSIYTNDAEETHKVI